jgi:sirohydrochlorin ferrochelatase
VKEDIPAIVAEAALLYPGIKYKIAEPLGLQEGILDLIHASVVKSVDQI